MDSSEDIIVVDDIDTVRFLWRSLFNNCFKVLIFFCKNNIWFIFSQSNRVRFSVTTFFAAEKKTLNDSIRSWYCTNYLCYISYRFACLLPLQDIKHWYELEVAKLQKDFGIFRSRSRSPKKFLIGVGVGIGVKKKNFLGIGVGIGVEKIFFSGSESGFGVKKCATAGL